MIFNHIKEGYYQLLILNGYDVIQIFLDIGENLAPRRLYCRTVGNRIYGRQSRYMSAFQRFLHTVCTSRLYADYLNLGIKQLRQRRYTSRQPAAADWHQNNIYERKLLKYLHCNRSLSGCNRFIIKRMNKRIAMLLCKLISMCARLIVYISMKHDLSPIALCSCYLHKRRSRRHYDSCFRSIAFCRISNALRMISCGSGNQSLLSVRIAQGAHLVVRAAHLICTCKLHILRL